MKIKEKIETKKYSGSKFWESLSYIKNVVAFLIKGKEFPRGNKEEIKFYKVFIKEGDLVFDIGANGGSKTKVFLKCGAKVIAVEPQKECINILKKKFGKIDMVEIVNKGLSSTRETKEINIFNSSPVSSFRDDWKDRMFSNCKIIRKEEVKMILILIEDLIDKYGIPDFCKIDVEGFELEVLKGLTSKIKLISFEFSKEFFKETLDVINYLSKEGYTKFNYTDNFNMTFKNDVWKNKNKFVSELITRIKNKDKEFFGDIYVS